MVEGRFEKCLRFLNVLDDIAQQNHVILPRKKRVFFREIVKKPLPFDGLSIAEGLFIELRAIDGPTEPALEVGGHHAMPSSHIQGPHSSSFQAGKLFDEVFQNLEAPLHPKMGFIGKTIPLLGKGLRRDQRNAFECCFH